MDDELEELRAIFLDECLENIELLEGGLMRMGEGENDLDTLNEVFRAAHSIKGGASTFGFMPMAEPLIIWKHCSMKCVLSAAA